MIRPRRWATAGLVGAALLLAPAPTAAPVAVSLVRPDTSKAVDFEDGLVWVLALGSDAQGPDPLDGNADAIELIALDLETGAGVALGIPRDTLVDVDGYQPAKINSALLVGSPGLMATEVEQLTGIAADYVLTTGVAGFEALVDEIGGVTVRSDIAFEDPESGLEVVVGRNPMDGAEAVSYARFRVLEGDDFTRASNHQRLLEAILAELRGRRMTRGSWRAAPSRRFSTWRRPCPRWSSPLRPGRDPDRARQGARACSPDRRGSRRVSGALSTSMRRWPRGGPADAADDARSWPTGVPSVTRARRRGRARWPAPDGRRGAS